MNFSPTDGQVGRLRRAMLLYLLLVCVCVADRDWKKDAAEARSRRGIPEPVDRKPRMEITKLPAGSDGRQLTQEEAEAEAIAKALADNPPPDGFFPDADAAAQAVAAAWVGELGEAACDMSHKETVDTLRQSKKKGGMPDAFNAAKAAALDQARQLEAGPCGACRAMVRHLEKGLLRRLHKMAQKEQAAADGRSKPPGAAALKRAQQRRQAVVEERVGDACDFPSFAANRALRKHCHELLQTHEEALSETLARWQEFDGIGELAKDFCHAQIGACSAQQLDGIDWEAVRAEGKAKAKPKAAKPAGPVCRCASPGRSRHWRRRCEQARPRTLRGGTAGSPRGSWATRTRCATCWCTSLGHITSSTRRLPRGCWRSPG